METKEIEIKDLKFLEEDLTREEMISIAFLLCSVERPLENISLIAKSKNFLQTFARNHNNWKSYIIDALATIKVFELIEKLGISIEEAREFSRKSSLINPGLKFLYHIAEACPLNATKHLIDYIKAKCTSLELTNEDQLEIYFLHCIHANLFKVNQLLDMCEFSFILNFFTINKYEVVERVLQTFPKKSNTLDNSISNDFNSQARQSSSETKNAEKITAAASNVLENYITRKMFVLIINQQLFTRDNNPQLEKLLPEHDLRERKGTFKDMDALKNLFENFNYHVVGKNNLTHIEILNELDKATMKSSQYDGLVVCVLSHGYEGIFYGSNSIPVPVREVKKIMSSKGLLGKPKLLLIQACQGSDLQRSVVKRIIHREEYDGPVQSDLTISGSTRADFLTFWSTIEGFASVRHIDDGSWFIQELTKKIKELHHDQHLMDICIAVIKEVSLKRGYRDECMLPKLESTFTKNFRFPKTI